MHNTSLSSSGFHYFYFFVLLCSNLFLDLHILESPNPKPKGWAWQIVDKLCAIYPVYSELFAILCNALLGLEDSLQFCFCGWITVFQLTIQVNGMCRMLDRNVFKEMKIVIYTGPPSPLPSENWSEWSPHHPTLVTSRCIPEKLVPVKCFVHHPTNHTTQPPNVRNRPAQRVLQ